MISRFLTWIRIRREQKKLPSEQFDDMMNHRDRLFVDIEQMESSEIALVKQGKASESKVQKRRIAGQISLLRKDLSRMNSQVTLVSKQLNVLSTHRHLITLGQSVTAADLPSAEELTEQAVATESQIEDLDDTVAAIDGIESSMSASSISDDEEAIMAEFEERSETAEKPTMSERVKEFEKNEKVHPSNELDET